MSAQYIIHKKNLIEKLNTYGEKCQIFYPIKSNSNSKVIKIIDSYVKGYEVDSICHLYDLVFRYKVNPNRIIFNTALKSIETLTKAIKWGVTKFVIDSVFDLNNLVSINSDAALTFLIRVDPSEFLTHTELLKWGASLDEITKLKAIISDTKHNFVGYSFYIPQEVNSIDNIKHVIYSLVNNVDFSDCKILDIGGGIPDEAINDIVESTERVCGNIMPIIIVEPGRHLLDPCIDLSVTVLAIRFKQGKKLVFIDSGIYDGLIDAKIKSKHFEIITKDSNYGNEKEECIICGNSADISDNLGRYILPIDLKVGDNLLILNCGAYCSEMKTNFCKNKRANYIVDS